MEAARPSGWQKQMVMMVACIPQSSSAKMLGNGQESMPLGKTATLNPSATPTNLKIRKPRERFGRRIIPPHASQTTPLRCVGCPPKATGTGENTVECGAVALACADCGDSTGCEEHALI